MLRDNHFSPGLGIAYSARVFGTNGKSSKAGNFYLFTTFQRSFEYLECALNDPKRIIVRKVRFTADSRDDFSLRYRHKLNPS